MAFQFKPEYAKRVVYYMIQMAEADDHFSADETQYLYDIADANDIDARVIFTGDKGLKPKDELDRVTILYYLIFMMKLDGKITSSESVMLRKAGLELGFRPSMIEEFIHLAVLRVKDRIAPNELLDIIRKYQN